MPRVLVGSRHIDVQQHFSTTVFVPVDDATITWELFLPDLLEWGTDQSSSTVILEARKAGAVIGRLVLKWGAQFMSFTMTWIAQEDVVSVHVLSTLPPITAVVVRSNDVQKIFIVDRVNKKILGDDGADSDGVNVKPAQDVIAALSGLPPVFDVIAQRPNVVFQSKNGGKECETDRKIGWVMAIGGMLAAVTAVPTGGMSLAALAVTGAAIGAVGGATAAKTDNDYKKCKEKAKKKEEETKE